MKGEKSSCKSDLSERCLARELSVHAFQPHSTSTRGRSLATLYKKKKKNSFDLRVVLVKSTASILITPGSRKPMAADL